jgi:hypothetical protein
VSITMDLSLPLSTLQKRQSHPKVSVSNQLESHKSRSLSAISSLDWLFIPENCQCSFDLHSHESHVALSPELRMAMCTVNPQLRETIEEMHAGERNRRLFLRTRLTTRVRVGEQV